MKRHCTKALLLLVGVCLVSVQCTAAQHQDANTGEAATPAQEVRLPAEIPDAPSSSLVASRRLTIPSDANPYSPLTRRQKLALWLDYTHSPYTLFSAGLAAGFAEATGEWGQYGGGIAGYGKRLGAAMADTEAAGFFKVFLFPSLLHQDPRYFAMRRGSKRTRTWYAATRVLVIRKDNGEDTCNSSEVLGRLFTRSVENSYYPSNQRGFRVTMTGTGEGIASDAGSSVLREFWPDLRRLFRKHEPDKIRKIEEKLPE
jgi:hypothetical protein